MDVESVGWKDWSEAALSDALKDSNWAGHLVYFEVSVRVRSLVECLAELMVS